MSEIKEPRSKKTESTDEELRYIRKRYISLRVAIEELAKVCTNSEKRADIEHDLQIMDERIAGAHQIPDHQQMLDILSFLEGLTEKYKIKEPIDN
ncbi:MAG: hypothetical protein WC752_04580 [Patescibacteria group bacterium]